MLQIDFLATQPHYIDHIAPVWDALYDENVGSFYTSRELFGYAQSRLKHNLYLFEYDDKNRLLSSDNPILVCAYGDMKHCHLANPKKRLFMMEHGTGHGFGTSAYPNGPGDRDLVSLFLPPNQYTADKIHTVRDTPCEVIGTPKLDWIAHHEFKRGNPPTVCISFHHGTKRTRIPEAGSALEHYKEFIPTLKENYNLVAHGHPLTRERDKPFYASLGIPFIDDFTEVLKTVDLYINDLSSTLYEFIATSKPVIVLNAPWFRREVKHGLRFWDYTDIGFNVEEPEELLKAIDTTLRIPELFLHQRRKATRELFPYLGHSAQRAAAVIHEQLHEEKNVAL
jgi:hypothetical protein